MSKISKEIKRELVLRDEIKKSLDIKISLENKLRFLNNELRKLQKK